MWEGGEGQRCLCEGWPLGEGERLWALGEGKAWGQGGKGIGKIWNQEKKADKETFNQTQNPHWPPNGAFVQ